MLIEKNFFFLLFLNRFFTINILFLSLIIFFFVYLYSSFNKFTDFALYLVQEYSNKYNYNLEKIEVLGLKNINKTEILLPLNKFKNYSIFLIPVKKISNEIKKNKWVNKVNVRNNYTNTLTVNIKEEIPMGIFVNNNQKILFSNNLVILEILDNNHDFKNLIIFYGENSINNSKNLILKIDQDIMRMIRTATFIEETDLTTAELITSLITAI